VTKKNKESTRTYNISSKYKVMSITECIKGTHYMKKLQLELKTMQTKKKAIQEELELIQEQAMQMIVQLEEENKNMTQAQTKCVALIQEEIITQSMEALTGKVTQVQERGRELTHKFHNLVEAIQGACTA
jgi:predicted  nucleic acid-binding Zn-ribbon protein